MSRYLLDHHHLCEKLKEHLGILYEDKERREEAINKTLGYLNNDDVDGALSYIQKLIDKFHSKRKLYHLNKLAAYIERNRDGIWYREAKGCIKFHEQLNFMLGQGFFTLTKKIFSDKIHNWWDG